MSTLNVKKENLKTSLKSFGIFITVAVASFIFSKYFHHRSFIHSAAFLVSFLSLVASAVSANYSVGHAISLVNEKLAKETLGSLYDIYEKITASALSNDVSGVYWNEKNELLEIENKKHNITVQLKSFKNDGVVSFSNNQLTVNKKYSELSEHEKMFLTEILLDTVEQIKEQEQSKEEELKKSQKMLTEQLSVQYKENLSFRVGQLNFRGQLKQNMTEK